MEETKIPANLLNRVQSAGGKCLPEDPKVCERFTCKDWKKLLPSIHAEIAELICTAGVVSDLDGEKMDGSKAIKTLTALAEWIEMACCRACGPYSELIPTEIDSCGCGNDIW